MAEGWAKDVLDFWFSHQWDDWWKPDTGFDDEIRDKFGILWARMARREAFERQGAHSDARQLAHLVPQSRQHPADH